MDRNARILSRAALGLLILLASIALVLALAQTAEALR